MLLEVTMIVATLLAIEIFASTAFAGVFKTGTHLIVNKI